MSPVYIVILMSAVVLLYCIVYFRKLSRPQQLVRSVLSTIGGFTIGWLAISFLLILTYSISTNVNGNFSPEVTVAFYIASTALYVVSVVLLSFGNLSKYYRKTFV